MIFNSLLNKTLLSKSDLMEIMNWTFFDYSLFCICICLIIILMVTFFFENSKSSLKSRQDTQQSIIIKGDEENCSWCNLLITWIYLNLNSCPIWINQWIQSINSQQGTHWTKQDINNKITFSFDHLLPGSLPPRIIEYRTNTGEKTRRLIVHLKVFLQEFGFHLNVFQTSSKSSANFPCAATIYNFEAQIQIECEFSQNELIMKVNVSDIRQMNIEITSLSTDDKLSSILTSTDSDWMKKCIDSALRAGTTEIRLGGQDGQSQTLKSGIPEIQINGMECPGQSLSKCPRITAKRGSKLLVKVIKAYSKKLKPCSANNVDRQNGAYVSIELDKPFDRMITTLQKDICPFWDQEFCLNLDWESSELQFELLSREDGMVISIGKAEVLIDSIMRCHSCRQILPLKSVQKSRSNNLGSLTVEFRYLEPDESGNTIWNEEEQNLNGRSERNTTSQEFLPSIEIIVPSIKKTDKENVVAQPIDPQEVAAFMCSTLNEDEGVQTYAFNAEDTFQRVLSNHSHNNKDLNCDSNDNRPDISRTSSMRQSWLHLMRMSEEMDGELLNTPSLITSISTTSSSSNLDSNFSVSPKTPSKECNTNKDFMKKSQQTTSNSKRSRSGSRLSLTKKLKHTFSSNNHSKSKSKESRSASAEQLWEQSGMANHRTDSQNTVTNKTAPIKPPSSDDLLLADESEYSEEQSPSHKSFREVSHHSGGRGLSSSLRKLFTSRRKRLEMETAKPHHTEAS